MRKIGIGSLTAAIVVMAVMTDAGRHAAAQTEKSPYPVMAPLDQYLMPEADEIALARSAAPKGVSDAAEVMVLRKDGYATAVKGTNGFMCIVERAWANETTAADFWNPKMRAPNCYNAAGAKTFENIYLMKTRWVLEGKSPKEIAKAIASARETKQLPELAPGAMAYMMSKQQYLNDGAKAWHPQTMFLTAGDTAKSWGADQPGSPIMSGYDPEERVTILFVIADKWSDGTPGPPML